MKLHELSPVAGSTHVAKRKGRGIAPAAAQQQSVHVYYPLPPITLFHLK